MAVLYKLANGSCSTMSSITVKVVIDNLVDSGLIASAKDIVNIIETHKVKGAIAQILIELKEATLDVKVTKYFLEVRMVGVDDFCEIVNISY